jgi:pilus assembly protein CpaC
MTEVQPAAFILDTAARRLRQATHAPAPASGSKANVARKTGHTSPAVAARPAAGAAPPAKPVACARQPALRFASRTGPAGAPVRLAQADAAGGPAAASPAYGDLKTAPAAADSRIRNFGSAPLETVQHGVRSMKVGESQVLGFRWVNRVAIGNPAIADVVPLSDNQVLVNGKSVGETNLFVWDNQGQHEYKVTVLQETQDMSTVARLVSHDLGRNDIKVQAINDSLFLFGEVKTSAEQQQAEAIAAAYTKNVRSFIRLVQDTTTPAHAPAADVANALNEVFTGGSVKARALSDGMTVVLEGNVTGEKAQQAHAVAQAMAKGVTVVDYFEPSAAGLRQVLVRSRVIDIDKVKVRQLGVKWGPVQTVVGPGGIVQNFVGQQPFSFGELPQGPYKLNQGGSINRFQGIGFTLEALENQNAARVLSEPNMMVMEGSKGGILIGGEIPIPVAQQAGTGVGTSITVEYKPFGIRLDAEVLGINGDEITLRISPEVSALDYTNAVTVNGFNIPALRTRREDSVVRIRAGQTLAIGGLLQNDLNKQTEAIPLLSKIPILGNLFKDTRWQKGESELIILVTPELPVAGAGSMPVPNVKMEVPNPEVKLHGTR